MKSRGRSKVCQPSRSGTSWLGWRSRNGTRLETSGRRSETRCRIRRRGWRTCRSRTPTFASVSSKRWRRIHRSKRRFERSTKNSVAPSLMAWRRPTMIQRGEIYFVNLNPVQGREQAGVRPVLVISSDRINRLPLVATVIVGTKGANITNDYWTNVRIPAASSGLSLVTVFLCFQIRSLDYRRFPAKPSGRIPDASMRIIEATIAECLELGQTETSGAASGDV